MPAGGAGSGGARRRSRPGRNVVKVLGIVNAAPVFDEHPKLIAGRSGLLGRLFGGRGRRTRAAFGMGSLLRGMPVEIKIIIAVK